MLKTFALALIGTFIAGSAALAQPQQPQPPDVTILHDGILHGLRSENDRSDEAIYKLLAETCAKAEYPDYVHLNHPAKGGQYDQLDLGKLAGFGAYDRSIALTMTKQHDRIGPLENPTSPAGPSVLLGSQPIAISKILLVQNCWQPSQDAALIGWGEGTASGDATLIDVDLNGSINADYIFYCWVLGKYKLTVKASEQAIKDKQPWRWWAARRALSLDHNNATVDVTMDYGQFIFDANGSRSTGASSRNSPSHRAVVGNLVRGRGTWRVSNCDVWLKGLDALYGGRGPLVNAPFGNDFYSASNAGLVFTGKNIRIRKFEPGVATTNYELNFRWGAVGGKESVDNSTLSEPVRLAGIKTMQEASLEYQAKAKQVEANNVEARGGSLNADGSFRVWEAAK